MQKYLEIHDSYHKWFINLSILGNDNISSKAQSLGPYRR